MTKKNNPKVKKKLVKSFMWCCNLFEIIREKVRRKKVNTIPKDTILLSIICQGLIERKKVVKRDSFEFPVSFCNKK